MEFTRNQIAELMFREGLSKDDAIKKLEQEYKDKSLDNRGLGVDNATPNSDDYSPGMSIKDRYKNQVDAMREDKMMQYLKDVDNPNKPLYYAHANPLEVIETETKDPTSAGYLSNIRLPWEKPSENEYNDRFEFYESNFDNAKYSNADRLKDNNKIGFSQENKIGEFVKNAEVNNFLYSIKDDKHVSSVEELYKKANSISGFFGELYNEDGSKKRSIDKIPKVDDSKSHMTEEDYWKYLLLEYNTMVDIYGEQDAKDQLHSRMNDLAYHNSSAGEQLWKTACGWGNDIVTLGSMSAGISLSIPKEILKLGWAAVSDYEYNTSNNSTWSEFWDRVLNNEITQFGMDVSNYGFVNTLTGESEKMKESGYIYTGNKFESAPDADWYNKNFGWEIARNLGFTGAYGLMSKGAGLASQGLRYTASKVAKTKAQTEAMKFAIRNTEKALSETAKIAEKSTPYILSTSEGTMAYLDTKSSVYDSGVENAKAVFENVSLNRFQKKLKTDPEFAQHMNSKWEEFYYGHLALGKSPEEAEFMANKDWQTYGVDYLKEEHSDELDAMIENVDIQSKRAGLWSFAMHQVVDGAVLNVAQKRLIDPAFDRFARFNQKFSMQGSTVGSNKLSWGRKAWEYAKEPLGEFTQEHLATTIDKSTEEFGNYNIESYLKNYVYSGDAYSELGKYADGSFNYFLNALKDNATSKEAFMSGIHGAIGSIVGSYDIDPTNYYGTKKDKYGNTTTGFKFTKQEGESTWEYISRVAPWSNPLMAAYRDIQRKESEIKSNNERLQSIVNNDNTRDELKDVAAILAWEKELNESIENGDEWGERNSTMGSIVQTVIAMEKLGDSGWASSFASHVEKASNLSSASEAEQKEFIDEVRKENPGLYEKMSDTEIVQQIESNAKNILSTMSMIKTESAKIDKDLPNIDINTKESLLFSSVRSKQAQQQLHANKESLKDIEVINSVDNSNLTDEEKKVRIKYGKNKIEDVVNDYKKKLAETKDLLDTKKQKLKNIKDQEKRDEIKNEIQILKENISEYRSKISESTKDLKYSEKVDDTILSESDIMALDDRSKGELITKYETINELKRRLKDPKLDSKIRDKYSKKLKELESSISKEQLNVIDNLVKQGSVQDSKFSQKIMDNVEYLDMIDAYAGDYNKIRKDNTYLSKYIKKAKMNALYDMSKSEYERLSKIDNFEEFESAYRVLESKNPEQAFILRSKFEASNSEMWKKYRDLEKDLDIWHKHFRDIAEDKGLDPNTMLNALGTLQFLKSKGVDIEDVNAVEAVLYNNDGTHTNDYLNYLSELFDGNPLYSFIGGGISHSVLMSNNPKIKQNIEDNNKIKSNASINNEDTSDNGPTLVSEDNSQQGNENDTADFKAFSEASKANTRDAYQKYLDDFQEGEYREAARDKMFELEEEEKQRKNKEFDKEGISETVENSSGFTANTSSDISIEGKAKSVLNNMLKNLQNKEDFIQAFDSYMASDDNVEVKEAVKELVNNIIRKHFSGARFSNQTKNPNSSQMESLDLSYTERTYPNGAVSNYTKQHKVSEYLNNHKDEIESGKKEVVFITDESLNADIKSKLGDGYDRTTQSSVIAVVQDDNGSIEIDGIHYQPIAVMPANNTNNNGVSYVSSLRQNANSNSDSNTRIIKDFEGNPITAKIVGEIKYNTVTSTGEMNSVVQHMNSGNNNVVLDDNSLTSKEDRTKDDGYINSKKTFFSKGNLSVKTQGNRKALMFNHDGTSFEVFVKPIEKSTHSTTGEDVKTTFAKTSSEVEKESNSGEDVRKRLINKLNYNTLVLRAARTVADSAKNLFSNRENYVADNKSKTDKDVKNNLDRLANQLNESIGVRGLHLNTPEGYEWSILRKYDKNTKQNIPGEFELTFRDSEGNKVVSIPINTNNPNVDVDTEITKIAYDAIQQLMLEGNELRKGTYRKLQKWDEGNFVRFNVDFYKMAGNTNKLGGKTQQEIEDYRETASAIYDDDLLFYSKAEHKPIPSRVSFALDKAEFQRTSSQDIDYGYNSDGAIGISGNRGVSVIEVNPKEVENKVKSMIENSKKWKHSKDNNHYINSENPTPHMRVTKVIQADPEVSKFDQDSPYTTPSTIFGTSTDNAVRKTVSEFKKVIDGKMTSDQAINNIKSIAEKEFPNLSEDNVDSIVKETMLTLQVLANKGFEVTSDNIVVSGSMRVTDATGKQHNLNIAGTIDLLMYNKSTGEYNIIDVKTKRGGDFATDKAALTKYAKQLYLYKKLLEEQYGIKISDTYVMGFGIAYTEPNKHAANYRENDEGILEVTSMGETKIAKPSLVTKIPGNDIAGLHKVKTSGVFVNFSDLDTDGITQEINDSEEGKINDVEGGLREVVINEEKIEDNNKSEDISEESTDKYNEEELDNSINYSKIIAGTKPTKLKAGKSVLSTIENNIDNIKSSAKNFKETSYYNKLSESSKSIVDNILNGVIGEQEKKWITNIFTADKNDAMALSYIIKESSTTTTRSSSTKKEIDKKCG